MKLTPLIHMRPPVPEGPDPSPPCGRYKWMASGLTLHKLGEQTLLVAGPSSLIL